MTSLRAALLGGLLACCVSACTVTVPAGEPVYEPPAYVVEPSTSVWVWGPWPHYEVEHNYIVNNERVIIRDRHYTPLNRQTHRYIYQDQGPHRGWYRHR